MKALLVRGRPACGVAYGVIRVKSPAPPIIALLGLDRRAIRLQRQFHLRCKART